MPIILWHIHFIQEQKQHISGSELTDWIINKSGLL